MQTFVCGFLHEAPGRSDEAARSAAVPTVDQHSVGKL